MTLIDLTTQAQAPQSGGLILQSSEATSSLTGLYTLEFDSIDEQPVDLIFLLLAPDIAGADHLKALSQISRVMSDSQMCGKLRKLNSRDDIYTLLTEATDQK